MATRAADSDRVPLPTRTRHPSRKHADRTPQVPVELQPLWREDVGLYPRICAGEGAEDGVVEGVGQGARVEDNVPRLVGGPV